MKFIGINICPKKDSGLCNQLYSLITGICYCIDNKINIVFINKFYKSVNTENYCNISEILDIDYLNSYLSRYGIFLVDSNQFRFNITNAFITNHDNNIIRDVTNDIKSYLSNNQFSLSKFSISNYTNLIPEININLNSGYKLLVKYQLNNGFFEEYYPIIDNKLIEPVNYDFINLPYHIFSVCGEKHPYFWEILKNIKFSDTFINKANDIKKIICNNDSQQINCIHLRLENDYIEHYENIYKIDKKLIKKAFEDAYIQTINESILKSELTIVLSGDFDNNVIKFLQNNNYNFITTSKLYEDRELNAIVDLEIGLLCNHTYIYTFESSFSYTLLHKLSNNTNIIKRMLILEHTITNGLPSQHVKY
jgi:hypothetical protein